MLDWLLTIKSQYNTIVEASPQDTIWGIGLGEANPDCQDESKWKGQNLLGKCIDQAYEFIEVDRLISVEWINMHERVKNIFDEGTL